MLSTLFFLTPTSVVYRNYKFYEGTSVQFADLGIHVMDKNNEAYSPVFGQFIATFKGSSVAFYDLASRIQLQSPEIPWQSWTNLLFAFEKTARSKKYLKDFYFSRFIDRDPDFCSDYHYYDYLTAQEDFYRSKESDEFLMEKVRKGIKHWFGQNY